MQESVKCPFCGKEDIEFGLALCSGCHADIEYDYDENFGQEVQAQTNALISEADRLGLKADRQPFPIAYFTLKRAKALAEQATNILEGEAAILKKGLHDKRARGDYTCSILFSRGDRSIATAVYVPTNPGYSVADLAESEQFKVVLMASGKRRADITRVVKNERKVGLVAAIKLVDDLPLDIAIYQNRSAAEKLSNEITRLGGVAAIESCSLQTG